MPQVSMNVLQNGAMLFLVVLGLDTFNAFYADYAAADDFGVFSIDYAEYQKATLYTVAG